MGWKIAKYLLNYNRMTLYDPHGLNDKVTLLFELGQDRWINSHFLLFLCDLFALMLMAQFRTVIVQSFIWAHGLSSIKFVNRWSAPDLGDLKCVFCKN